MHCNIYITRKQWRAKLFDFGSDKLFFFLKDPKHLRKFKQIHTKKKSWGGGI